MVSAKLFRMIKCHSLSPPCLLVLEEMAGCPCLSQGQPSVAHWFHASVSWSYKASIKHEHLCICRNLEESSRWLPQGLALWLVCGQAFQLS